MESKKLWRGLWANYRKQLVYVPIDLVRYAFFHELKTRHHHLLVACMPKSGSTYLAAMLANLPHFQTAQLVPGYGRREQELDPTLMLLHNRMSYVAQHHVRFSGMTEIWLRDFGIKPVVLVRNIFDIVKSMADHFRNEATHGSAAYAYPEMAKWDQVQLEEFIACMAIPWYFNFYLTWLECTEKELVTYEELNRDPSSVVERINRRFELGCDASDIASAIRKANESSFTRKNQAVVGRGKELSENAREHIYKMASFYKGVDFSPIGL